MLASEYAGLMRLRQFVFFPAAVTGWKEGFA
jgi:hypothetical protein